LKEKHICENTPMAHELSGLAEEVMACGRDGPVRGWLGLSSQIHRENFQQEMIFNFQWILEFGKNLEICTRRFRRNFNVRIFPKFF
jgi:hypothetical protein